MRGERRGPGTLSAGLTANVAPMSKIIEEMTPEQMKTVGRRGAEAIAQVLRRERPGHLTTVVERQQGGAELDGNPGSALARVDDDPAEHRP